MKKQIALLSALVMLGTAGIMPVQADENHWIDHSFISADSLTELDSGEAGVSLYENLDGFAVITDAEGLDISLFEGCSIYEVTGACDWASHLPAEMQANDNRYYVVDSSPTIYRSETGGIIIPYSNDVIRHAMVESENIRYIADVSRTMDGTAVWNGDFYGTLETGSPNDWKVEGSLLSDYVKVLEEMDGTAYDTKYAELRSAFAWAEELTNINPDKAVYVLPEIITAGLTETAEYSYADVWENVGDIDGINGVNAADAAELLIAAAAYGAAGEYPEFDLFDKKVKFDVNADGVINASDAAIVLQYAAAVGAGQKDVQLIDFIR